MTQHTLTTFANGKQAIVLSLDPTEDLATTLQAAGLQTTAPALVIIGGASQMTQESIDRVHQLFQTVLAPLAEALNAVVIDGGTDTGVMQMMGQSRTAMEATFCLLGVAPASKVSLPGKSNPNGEPLEPNHTHFVLTPGTEWGDESPWISAIASLLAADRGAVTVLINGGAVSLLEVTESLQAGRPVVVIAGSGRLADAIATAIASPEALQRDAIAPLLASKHLLVFDRDKPLSALTDLLKKHLRHQN
ncbi:MAG: hypothetical protein KME45_29965 [Stenomitos rutilans HA7619-LM2]|jgi:hypothetical protein|nr:hypothetical protein [Stenomitos rutilans HA7619-LM2]